MSKATKFYNPATKMMQWFADGAFVTDPLVIAEIEAACEKGCERVVLGVLSHCIIKKLSKETGYQVSDFDPGDLVIGQLGTCNFTVSVDDSDPQITITPIDGYAFTDDGNGNFTAAFTYNGQNNPSQPLEATIVLSTGEIATLTGSDFYLCSGGGGNPTLEYSGKEFVKEICLQGLPSEWQDSAGEPIDPATIEICPSPADPIEQLITDCEDACAESAVIGWCGRPAQFAEYAYGGIAESSLPDFNAAWEAAGGKTWIAAADGISGGECHWFCPAIEGARFTINGVEPGNGNVVVSPNPNAEALGCVSKKGILTKGCRDDEFIAALKALNSVSEDVCFTIECLAFVNDGRYTTAPDTLDDITGVSFTVDQLSTGNQVELFNDFGKTWREYYEGGELEKLINTLPYDIEYSYEYLSEGEVRVIIKACIDDPDIEGIGLTMAGGDATIDYSRETISVSKKGVLCTNKITGSNTLVSQGELFTNYKLVPCVNELLEKQCEANELQELANAKLCVIEQNSNPAAPCSEPVEGLDKEALTLTVSGNVEDNYSAGQSIDLQNSNAESCGSATSAGGAAYDESLNVTVIPIVECELDEGKEPVVIVMAQPIKQVTATAIKTIKTLQVKTLVPIKDVPVRNVTLTTFQAAAGSFAISDTVQLLSLDKSVLGTAKIAKVSEDNYSMQENTVLEADLSRVSYVTKVVAQKEVAKK